MDEKKNGGMSEFVKKMFKIGTPECALFCGVIAMIVAILLLTIGFWKTVLIAAVVALGMVIGGVGNKTEKAREVVDKIVPKKDTQTYTNDDLRRYGLKNTEAAEETAAPAAEEELIAEDTLPKAEPVVEVAEAVQEAVTEEK